jgi:hypothetical protein
LRDTIPYYKKLHEFFQQLEGISQEISIAHKSQAVHELIEKGASQDFRSLENAV